MSNTYNFTKFCNQNVMDIKDELLKSFILKKLDEFYYLKKKKIISEEELEIIKNEKYPIFLEYNSYRVLIFLTKYQNRSYCIIIDQNIPNKVKMLITKMRFNIELYQDDTIFDVTIDKRDFLSSLKSSLPAYESEELYEECSKIVNAIDYLKMKDKLSGCVEGLKKK